MSVKENERWYQSAGQSAGTEYARRRKKEGQQRTTTLSNSEDRI
jgi:hypothetical protein